MHSFFIAVFHNDDCVIAEQVIGTVDYLGSLLRSSRIIRENGNPEHYRIDAITNFGAKDPFASKTVTFGPDGIRNLAEAAVAAGIDYEKGGKYAEN